MHVNIHIDLIYMYFSGIWGPHLVVVRTCKILSWEMEFKRWCPGLKILLYLGNRQERRAKRMVTSNDLFQRDLFQ